MDATQLMWTQIAAGVVLLLFAGSLWNLLRLRAQMRASKSWGKTEGEIVVSELKIPATHRSDDDDDVRALIHYRYSVGTETFKSECIKLGGQTAMARADAQALVAKYPIGARVDVFYDPRDPKTCALDPSRPDNFVAQLVFTIVFGAIGAVLAAHAVAGKVLYTSNGVPLFAFLLPAAAFMVGIIAVVSFVRDRRQAHASVGWPTVSGTITTCGVVEETIEDKDDDDKGRQPRTRTQYRVDLRYGYRVAGRDYVATTRSWGWTAIYGLREMAEQAIGPYKKGKTVKVYYDPKQPGIAVLEPNNRKGTLAPLVFGGVFAAAGAGMLALFVNVGFSP
jgi:hypothetical protein